MHTINFSHVRSFQFTGKPIFHIGSKSVYDLQQQCSFCLHQARSIIYMLTNLHASQFNVQLTFSARNARKTMLYTQLDLRVKSLKVRTQHTQSARLMSGIKLHFQGTQHHTRTQLISHANALNTNDKFARTILLHTQSHHTLTKNILRIQSQFTIKKTIQKQKHPYTKSQTTIKSIKKILTQKKNPNIR